MGANNSQKNAQCIKGDWYCDVIKFQVTERRGEWSVMCWEQKSMQNLACDAEWVFKYEMPLKDLGRGLSFAGFVLNKKDIPSKRTPNMSIVWSQWHNDTTMEWSRRYIRAAEYRKSLEKMRSYLNEKGLGEFFETLKSQNYAGKLNKLQSIDDKTLSKWFSEKQIQLWRTVYSEPFWISDEISEHALLPENTENELPVSIMSEFDMLCGDFCQRFQLMTAAQLEILCSNNMAFRAFSMSQIGSSKLTLDDVREFFTLPSGDQDIMTIAELNDAMETEIREAVPSSPLDLYARASKSFRGVFESDANILAKIWGEEEEEDNLLADLWMGTNLLSVNSAKKIFSPTVKTFTPIVKAGVNAIRIATLL